jgi:hypothetical protein
MLNETLEPLAEKVFDATVKCYTTFCLMHAALCPVERKRLYIEYLEERELMLNADKEYLSAK